MLISETFLSFITYTGNLTHFEFKNIIQQSTDIGINCKTLHCGKKCYTGSWKRSYIQRYGSFELSKEIGIPVYSV